nr:zinc finger, CCHC-type, retrotransposon Gag domain protein [Tanacetum cinerariifolium]
MVSEPEIREEFRTSSRPSDAGGNPPPVTIHTWLERVNKQKPHSFEKATAPVDAENWISHMEKIFDVMGCENAFKTRLDVYKFEAASTEEEQEKNFQWGLRRSTLNHLMCMSYTDVAQVANAARNYEILHERDDDDAERPDKRRVVIGISRPLNRVVTRTTVIIMIVMDQTGEAVVTTTAAAITTTLATTTG